MKIPFDIKYRDKIESGEYKVVTRGGSPVRIVCWDYRSSGHFPIIGIVDDGDVETNFSYQENGRMLKNHECTCDLFLVTPDELTEFEEKVKQLIGNYPVATRENQGSLIYEVRKASDELLSLALEQFIKDGYVIEKKSFIENTLEYKAGFRAGKAEALKDLPRWKDNWDSLRPYKDISGLQYIVLNGRAMNVSDLTKLPGFKED